MAVCDKNCFECKYEDCIQGEPNLEKKYHREYMAKWRAENAERYRARQNKWRNEHKDEINEKNRMKRLLNRHCFSCGTELREKKSIVRYKSGYFCDTCCLGDYLVSQADEKGLIKTVIMPVMGGEVKNG